MNVFVPDAAVLENGHMASHTRVQAGISGLGHRVPDQVLSNADLEKMVDTTDEWIFARTGIRERRIVASGETLVDLCSGAAQTRA